MAGKHGWKRKIIFGSRGDDVLAGGDGRDVIFGRAGDDFLTGGAGDDFLFGGRGADVLDGGADNDRLFGGAGIDVLDGGAGDDWLFGGAGADTLLGGTGNDILIGGGDDDDDDDDRARPRGPDDHLDGGAGDDLIRAGAGADTVIGGAGNERVFAGSGDDRAIYRLPDNLDATDLYDGGAGTDTLHLVLNLDQALDPAVQADLAAYSDFLAARPSPEDDDDEDDEDEDDEDDDEGGGAFTFGTFGLEARSFEALSIAVDGVTSGDVTIQHGTAGDETLTGTTGSDLLLGGGGGDTLDGGAGDDVLDGGDGDDRLIGGAGADVLYAGAGDDFVDGGGGDDLIIGGTGAGDDTYIGGPGNDTVDYGSTTLGVDVNLFEGTASGPEIGNDILIDINNVIGGIGNDIIVGGNELWGGKGNDVLRGWVPHARLIGGDGSDTYVVAPGDGSLTVDETITEVFDPGIDTLRFDSLAATDLNFRREGSDLIVDIGFDDRVTVLDQYLENLERGIEKVAFDFGTPDFHSYDFWSDIQVGDDDGNRLTGNDFGDDLLYGNGGGDELRGRTGNDILIGGAGADTYVFAAWDGWDTVYDSADGGTLRFDGVAATDLTLRRAGDDMVVDYTAFDSVRIQDHFQGGGGAVEKITAGARTYDFQVGSFLRDTLTGGSSHDLLFGADDNDEIIGETGDDILHGERGEDTLRGGLGDDTLLGGANEDILIGGRDNDWLYGSDGSDLYFFSAGDGQDTVFEVPDIASTDVDTLEFEGVQAGDLDLSVDSDPRHLIVDYGTGDRVRVIEQFFPFGNVIETIAVGGRTYDFQVGSETGDTLVGDTGHDLLHGEGGKDTLVASGGDDVLNGGDGVDWASYGDTVLGVTVDLATSVAIGAQTGADTLIDIENVKGGAGKDTLRGDGGTNILDGAENDDTLFGGAGSDALLGGRGNDTLTGGAGKDELIGGIGFDTAVFSGGWRDYTLKYGTGGRITVTDTVAGRDGIDALTEVEQAQFTDGAFFVDGTNNAPAVADDAATTNEDKSVFVSTKNLLANDADFDGDTFALTAVGNASHGTVAPTKDGAVFTPDADFSGTASFDYTVTDARGGISTATVTVDVAPVADAPTLTLFDATVDQNLADPVIGPEFQVNTHTAHTQVTPSVTALAGGGFVVIWESVHQRYDGSWGDIYGQLYGAGGTAIGDEFPINTYAAGSQALPTVAALADGGFVAIWSSDLQDGSSRGVFGQRFDGKGKEVGDEFQVNTFTTNHQDPYSVTGLPDGGFVVVWNSWHQDGSSVGVYGQLYDKYGATVGPEFHANTTTHSYQGMPAVAPISDVGFVVVWQSAEQDGSGYGIYGQRYDTAGNRVGQEFPVNSTTYSWQINPAVAALEDNGFVVTWQSYGQDGHRYGIIGQRFKANGEPDGPEFPVNSFTYDNQTLPSVTGLAGGGFVVTWASQVQDGSGEGIYGQRYNAAGTPVGDEFQISVYASSDQDLPSVTALAGGGFVAAWQSHAQDGDLGGIYARMFDVPGPTEVPLDITAALTDADGSEVLGDITIAIAADAPDGVSLSAGIDNGDGSWTLTPDELSNLTIATPANFYGAFDLTVTAVATEQATGDSATTGGTLTVTVLPPPLFTDGDDVVDFNTVTAGTYLPGSQYDAGPGNDVVTLADDPAAAGYDPQQFFHGGAGNDVITGGIGNDYIAGDAWNDILTGGAGRDVLFGSDGSDTYAFARGDGGDTVYDRGGLGDVDTLRFDGVAASDLDLYRHSWNNNHLIVDYGAGDRVIVEYQFYPNTSEDFNVEKIAVGGVTYDFQVGSDGRDDLFGTAGADLLFGGAGTDVFYGSFGNDVLNGGDNTPVGDFVDYRSTHLGFGVDLAAGTATGAGIGSDTLIGIENVLGGDGRDYITGDGGANRLDGGDGNDVVRGGGGDDDLKGNAGSDVYVFAVGDGADTILDVDRARDGFTDVDTLRFEGLAATDLSLSRVGDNMIVDYGAGDRITVIWQDVLTTNYAYGVEKIEAGGVTYDFQVGGDFDDELVGNAGHDLLFGWGGDDVFVGSAGNDVLTGGDNTPDGDAVDYSSTTLGVIVDLTAGTATGAGIGSDTLIGIENVHAGSGNDRITGDGGANDLIGYRGNDVVRGGGGDDVMWGSVGSDVYVFAAGDGADAVIDADLARDGITDIDRLRFDGVAATDLSLSRVGDNMIVDYGAGDRITVIWQDVLTTNYAYGVEKIEAGGVTYDFQVGSDTLIDIENVVGGSGNDDITGDGGANTLNGYIGNDTLTGGAGIDRLEGEVGSDTYVFAAGDGADTVFDVDLASDGFTDIDTLRFDGIAVTDLSLSRVGSTMIVDYGAGDRITVLSQGRQTGNYAYGVEKIEAGGVTYDFQVGTDAYDFLAGGAGPDLLFGGSGIDTLVGSAGNDILDGGAGDDLFVFADGDGADTIRDFTAGAGTEDKIDLAGVSDANSYADVTANAHQDGTDTVLDFAQVDIRLLGVQLDTLDQADFLFA